MPSLHSAVLSTVLEIYMDLVPTSKLKTDAGEGVPL
jgi:hypothetical protein